MTDSKGASDKTYALGMDFSTQSVKIVVLDAVECEVVYAGSIEYDTTFTDYGTRGGVLPAERPDIRHTSPFMLIEALDLAFGRLQDAGIDPGCVKAVKTDAMQHCTVYTDGSLGKLVAALDPGQPLLPQLKSSITRRTSPIWEDRSPVKEAAYLTKALEEHGSIQALTGNRAELRFPAAQVLKWASESPDEYSRTTQIFLLSAFLTSILAGKAAPVDTGDGWGTNLNTLDIHHPGWNEAVLKAADDYLGGPKTGLSLRGKLGEMVPYDTPLGSISPYFVRRYGVSPGAIVLAGTGDNPATLLGCGGHTMVSLGSSYTVNGVIQEITPSSTGEYNVFGYTAGKAMALSVFTNGAKVHESFLARYISQPEYVAGVQDSWETYVSAAGETVLKEDEKLMLPYLMEESVPLRSSGIVRDGFDERDAGANIRALHISQALALRLHSDHLSHPDTLCVVGGGARNQFLRQLIADVFDARVYTIRHADYAAPLGCAISGARAILGISYEEAAGRYVQVETAPRLNPVGENRSVIRKLLQRYEALENSTGA